MRREEKRISRNVNDTADDRLRLGAVLETAAAAGEVISGRVRRARALERKAVASPTTPPDWTADDRVFDLDGRPLVYGIPGGFNTGFLAKELYEPFALRPSIHSTQAMGHFK